MKLPSSDSLFGDHALETPASLAAALAPPAAPGHYDELRGAMTPPPGPAGRRPAASHGLPARPWARFFENLGSAGFQDLDRRSANLQQQIRDNGVSYNVYADPQTPQRPWALDLFPLIVTAHDWRRIEAGVLQRVRLLDRILADVYGGQQLLARGLLPPALVQGHPGYLRPMHGVQPCGGNRLHIAAFDLARDPAGAWWVLSQRTQSPSGLGYLLENRLLISRLFPEAFRDLKVQRLAGTYRALIEGLREMAPGQGEPRIVLLTPGPYNETWFEHAYLARFLGLPLVEGGDLTVRDQRLYLKTLKGLEPVHAVIKRLDDEFLDPLELRADSRLGVPGLLQAVRAGNVLLANAPGSGLLESTALLGFLPGLAQHLLGEELRLPSLASWWCGERAALDAGLPQLAGSMIKPTCGAGAGAVLGRSLPPHEREAWARRLAREPDDWTLQAWLPLSQMPTWKEGAHAQRILPRSLMLRVFAVSDGPQSWRVLPGGLTRIAAEDLEIASMQRGGSSADTWVLADGEVDHGGPALHDQPVPALAHAPRLATSRAAESLFWLGRYSERTENTARLARLALESLTGEDQSVRPLLAWLDDMAVTSGLVPPTVPGPTRARRVFERALIAGLADAGGATGVGFNLQALRRAASGVRERLSQEQWNVIVRAEQDFVGGCAGLTARADYSSLEALRLLEALSGATAAMTGAQTDRMTRDDGWRLLSIGRHLERLAFLATALVSALETGALHDDGGFDAVVALFDSTITFRAQYQERHDLPALVDLLVLDRENPRALGWVLQTLRGRLAKLAGSAAGELPPIAAALPDPQRWNLHELCGRAAGGEHTRLLQLLQECAIAAWHLSDELGARYFTHSEDARHSVGA